MCRLNTTHSTPHSSLPSYPIITPRLYPLTWMRFETSWVYYKRAPYRTRHLPKRLPSWTRQTWRPRASWKRGLTRRYTMHGRRRIRRCRSLHRGMWMNGCHRRRMLKLQAAGVERRPPRGQRLAGVRGRVTVPKAPRRRVYMRRRITRNGRWWSGRTRWMFSSPSFRTSKLSQISCFSCRCRS